MTLTLVASGTSCWSSFWRRSGMLGNMVVPPDMTTLPRRSLRTSRAVVDSLAGELVETHHLLTVEGRFEHQLWATHHLVVHSDNLAVGHLELLLLAGEV